MPESSHVPKLPPLGITALGHVDAIEQRGRRLLKDCNGIPYNAAKAKEILRSCVDAAYSIRFGYYFSLKQKHSAWVYEIADQTLETIMAMLGNDVPEEFKTEIRPELRQVLIDERERFQAATVDPPAIHVPSEPGESEIQRRAKLLADYKHAAGDPSNRKIYSARNSAIHKPEFYDWVKGKLANDSQTCINFERFLQEKRPPIPKKA